MTAANNFNKPLPPDLGTAVRAWASRNPLWHSRPLTPGPAANLFLNPYAAYREATPDEIAADLAQNPTVRQALAALSSPVGQALEQAVLQFWLPPWQAKLLAAGLTQAWKIVLDQNRPAWQRGEVLLGTVLVIALVCYLIWG